jgi:hypothetical protein
MTPEFKEADIDGFVAASLSATRTAVVVAPGPMRPEMEHAFSAWLLALTAQDIPRILIEDEPGHVVLEIQRDQIVAVRVQSKFMSADIVVEVTAKSRDDAASIDSSTVVIGGPKRAVKQAFAVVGQYL